MAKNRNRPKQTAVRLRNPVTGKLLQSVLVENFPLSEVKTAEEFSPEDAAEIANLRMQMNFQETGHPLHHLTADGTIVDTDVTLEYLLGKLAAKPTVPVDRRHYGFDLYEGK